MGWIYGLICLGVFTSLALGYLWGWSRSFDKQEEAYKEEYERRYRIGYENGFQTGKKYVYDMIQSKKYLTKHQIEKMERRWIRDNSGIILRVTNPTLKSTRTLKYADKS